MPTSGMKEEAQRYRDWKKEGEAGGTEVAARRATQILSGSELSPQVVVEMSAWFARHEVDKKAEQKSDKVREGNQPSYLPCVLFFLPQHLNYFDTNLAVLPVKVLSFGGKEEREFLEHVVGRLTACDALDTFTNHFH